MCPSSRQSLESLRSWLGVFTVAIGTLRDSTFDREASISEAVKILFIRLGPGFLHLATRRLGREEESDMIFTVKLAVQIHQSVSVGDFFLL